jgi:hypothetical protein
LIFPREIEDLQTFSSGEKETLSGNEKQANLNIFVIGGV